MAKYSVGDNVKYKPVGGPDSNTAESTGTVKQVVTEPQQIAGVQAQASADRPCYEIENNNTKKTSAIYEDNILGRA